VRGNANCGSRRTNLPHPNLLPMGEGVTASDSRVNSASQASPPDLAENVTMSPYRHLAVGHFSTNCSLFFTTTGEDVRTHID